MSAIAIILLVLSAFLHALWNAAGKQSHPSPAFFLVATTVGCAVVAPAVVLYHSALTAFSPTVWMLIAATGFCLAVYYVALAGAYRTGDLSVAYPVARSSPVFVVTVATLILGRGDNISYQSIAGIILVVIGCFILPMKHFKDIRLKNYLNQSCMLAVGAALGTTGYSLCDDQALRSIRSAVDGSIGIPQVTLLFSFFEGLSGTLWLALFVFTFHRGPRQLGHVLRTQLGRSAFTGACIIVTYTLVLISMAFVADVSYVVAFRQLSVPIGALLGVAVLREPVYAPKIFGVLTMFLGLVLVGTG